MKQTKEIITICDMGQIKIFNKDISLFFDNHIGDVPTKVLILDKEPENTKEFLGHFTIKTEAYLSHYDCEDDAVYTFKKGRYFVYLIDAAKIGIVKQDEDIHA